MMRRLPEQEAIPGFTELDDPARRSAVEVVRRTQLAGAMLKGPNSVKLVKRNFEKTREYLHLTHAERVAVVQRVADLIGSTPSITIFADAQQKAAHSGTPERLLMFAFEQVVTRFHHFLKKTGPNDVGLLVQDNNDTSKKHLTSLMRKFHRDGTAWAKIPQIVETPLFVDSALTAMVQLADLCAYAARRFFENNENDLFDRIYGRFHRVSGKLVGLRHYTAKVTCKCRVCGDHGRQ